MFKFRLRNAPLSAKVLVLGFIGSLSLAYVYALLNIVLVVGWTPRDIAIHYYGSEALIQTTKSADDLKTSGDGEAAQSSGGEDSFDLDQLEEQKPVAEIGVRPSFKNLVTEGHFHLFGMTSFFFGLTLLGLFVEMAEVPKAFLVGIPYIAIVVDNLSLLATRFLGPRMAYLTAISGGLMALTFTALWFVILRETLKKAESK